MIGSVTLSPECITTRRTFLSCAGAAPVPAPSASIAPMATPSAARHLFPAFLTISRSPVVVLVVQIGPDRAPRKGPSVEASAQAGEEPGHEAPALHEAVHQDELLQRVITVAERAEAVEGGDAHRPREVAVRAAAGALVRDVEAEIRCDPARRVVELHGAGVRLPDRTRHAPRDLEGDVVVGSRERQDALDAAVEVGLALGL